MQRHPNYKCKNNEYTYEFNLDNKNCLNILHEQIKAITTSFEISTLVGHCLTGGSLRVEFGNAKESDIEKVFLHNCLTPMYATQLISSYAEKNQTCKNQIFYYSSAVTQNITSTPFYSSCKSALEAFYKNFTKIKPHNVFTCLLRLGPVDIDHKYFHKLSKEDPEKLNDILEKIVPTKHLIKPNEVADFAYYVGKQCQPFDGMIADITGGSSWKS